MPIGFDAAVASTWPGVGSSAIPQWTHPVGGADRLLIVGVAIRGRNEGDEVVSGILGNGSLPFTLGKHNIGDALFRSELWYLLNPPTGSVTVDVSLTGMADGALGGASLSLTGVDQASPIGAVEGVLSGVGATVTTPITTQFANSWLVDIAMTRNVSDINVKDANQTNRIESWDGIGTILGMSTKPVAVTSASDMGWIDGDPTRYWGHVILEVKVARRWFLRH